MALVSFDEKFQEIEKIKENKEVLQEELDDLKILAKDLDEEIRAMTAQALVFDESGDAEEILLEMIDDEEELVRVNVCDSLCIGKTINTLKALKNKIKDQSVLIRGYAILSIADVTLNGEFDKGSVLEYLFNYYKREKSVWVKGSYYYAFCKLGLREYYVNLLGLVNNRFYRIRCGALNLIFELVDDDNIEETIRILKQRKLIEKTIAVKSMINDILAELEE